jgi:hypothetical protein
MPRFQRLVFFAEEFLGRRCALPQALICRAFSAYEFDPPATARWFCINSPQRRKDRRGRAEKIRRMNAESSGLLLLPPGFDPPATAGGSDLPSASCLLASTRPLPAGGSDCSESRVPSSKLI